MSSTTRLRHVDLCSGIGGFSLGFSWAELSKTIMFCDTEKWCRQILNQNFPNIPIATDVKELANDPERLVPDHDILTAGYPCQPFSVAGLRKGEKDDRHIWPHIFRIVTFKRPTWCVFENVYGHVALGLDKVLSDMESQGYATRTFIVPACSKNAPHRRDRLWIVCKNVEDSNSGRLEERNSKSQEASRSVCTGARDGDGETLGDTSSGGRGRLQVSREEVGDSSSQEAQSVLASSVRGDVGDTQHNGSSTPKIKGSNEEDARGSQKGEIQAKQLEGTSGRGHHETLAHTKCLGWEQRTEIQGEFDREEPSDQSDISGEGRRRSRTSSHVAHTSSQGTGKDDQRLWERSEGVGRGEGTTMAHTSSKGLQGRDLDTTFDQGREEESQLGYESTREDVAHAISQRGRGGSTRWEDAEDVGQPSRIREDEGIWFSEPNVGRVAHGVSKRVDRLKGLGNAIVPQLAMQIGLAIKKEIDNDKHKK